jgi:hypothetical protein
MVVEKASNMGGDNMSHQLKGIFLLGFLSLFLMSSAVTLAEQPACTITLDPSQTVQETLDTAIMMGYGSRKPPI